ncbi:MAG: hypothetical protein IKC97_04635 [Clostridia bacterium]|nr:hypothetical protein [Clostridia bacterium]
MDENKNEWTNEEMNESLNEQPKQTQPTAEPTADSPSGEQELVTTASTPALAPKLSGAKKGLMIAGAIALILVSGVLLFCMAMGAFVPKTPVEKTMEAVFPEIALLDSIVTKGGSVSATANIGSDLSDRVQDKPVLMHADFVYGTNGLSLSGAIGSAEEQVDIGLLLDGDGVQIYSDRLLDGGYSIAFEGLIEGIDKSIFAPDSGTDYALPQELYDMIREYVESLNDPEQDAYEYEEIEVVLTAMLDAAMAHATIEEQTMTLALLDGSTTVTLHIMTLDAQAVIAATDVLLDAWVNNPEFYEELSSIVEAFMNIETDDMELEMDIDDIMDVLYDELEVAIDTLIEGMQQDNALIRLMYGIKSGYLVYMEMAFEVDMAVDKEEGKERSVTTLRWTMTGQPKKDPSYDIKLVSRLGEESVELFSMSYRKQEDRYTLVMTISDSELEGGESLLTLQGSQLIDGNYIALTIDGIELKSGDAVLFEMTESTISFEMQSGRQRVARRDPDVDLLTMTAQDMDALGEELEKKLNEFFEAVNASLGFDLFYDTLAVRTQSTLIMDMMADYAYDRKTGHLFVTEVDTNKHYYIVMYDVQTMEQLGKIQVGSRVIAMDADNGYLVYHLATDADFAINVINAENLKRIKTMYLKGMTGVTDKHLVCSDMLIDGDIVICLSGNSPRYVLYVDINKEDVIHISSGYHGATMAIDRENHVLGVNETNTTNCRIFMFDSLSGEQISQGKKISPYSYDILFFDGTSFYCFNYHFAIDGEAFTTAQMVKERKQSDREARFGRMVYKDTDILVTVEYDEDETYYTMFYDLTGEGQEAPLFEKMPNELYREIIKVGDGSYLTVCRFMGGWATFQYFTVEPTTDIDF